MDAFKVRGALVQKTVLLVLGMSLLAAAQPGSYSWQQPHATVLPNGDLAWAPQPFVYTPGASVRYIDFDAGDDANTGTSTASAFKHHPWDANATGNARTCSGIITYVFKRGVVYRGTLVADDNGVAGNPVRLTVDTAWGTGEACIYGSERLTSGWTRCTASDAPANMPNPTSVWYRDLGALVPSGQWTSTVCEVSGATFTRIKLARSPNWTITNRNDPMGNWWRFTAENGTTFIDATHLVQADANYWVGGTIWSQYGISTGAGGNMATVNQGRVNTYAPATHGLTITNQANARCMYYIENLPQLLDTTGEYYFSGGAAFPHRLFVRLSGDRDPNTAVIEVGVRSKIVSLVGRSNVAISGLSLGFNTQPNPATNTHWNVFDGNNQAVELSGTCDNIEVSNCTFRCVVDGIAPQPGDVGLANVMSNIRITDNDFATVDDQAITLGAVSGGSSSRDISVLRNRLSDIGGRQTCRGYSSIPAIIVGALWAEIAGNMLDYCWGTAIDGFWGRDRDSPTLSAPYIRGLVHHNKVNTSLLGTNDYGGIEGWMGGPVYYYSNISGNARGYKHFWSSIDGKLWGPAFYFDHAYGQKAFNNIAWGVGNTVSNPTQSNSTAFMQCVGNGILYANNTAHNFISAFSYSQPYDFYLGNLMDSISQRFHDETADLTFTSYVNNVYRGTPTNFSTNQATFTAFQQNLTASHAQADQLGWQTAGAVMVDPASGDFRPVAGGAAIDHGTKLFVPWSLYCVTGEWNFYQHPADPTVVQGENYAMVANWSDATPYNHLSCPGATLADFVPGALEDWTNGALRFNGTSTYGTVPNSQSSANASNNLDMTTNNFLLEAYLRTSASGVLVSKGTSQGYELDIVAGGQARMRLLSGAGYSLSTAVAVNDGAWHHILAEVDRAGSAVRMYVDGVASNGAVTGSMPGAGATLTNTADFYVGRNSTGNYFSGDVDFLRVSRGTLADGHTTIGELYAWELSGPFLRDFAGNAPVGLRDAGALENTSVGVLEPAVGGDAPAPGQAAASPQPAAPQVSAQPEPQDAQQRIDNLLQRRARTLPEMVPSEPAQPAQPAGAVGAQPVDGVTGVGGTSGEEQGSDVAVAPPERAAPRSADPEQAGTVRRTLAALGAFATFVAVLLGAGLSQER